MATMKRATDPAAHESGEAIAGFSYDALRMALRSALVHAHCAAVEIGPQDLPQPCMPRTTHRAMSDRYLAEVAALVGRPVDEAAARRLWADLVHDQSTAARRSEARQ